MEIKLDSVLEKVVEGHYGAVDWRIIDATGDRPVPKAYTAQSFINYAEFRDICQAGGFIASRDTVASKWRALTGCEAFILQPGKRDRTAFIDLAEVKRMVPKYARIRFDITAYEDANVRVQGARVTAEQEASE